MLKALFDEQRRYLNHFFDAIDLGAVEKVRDQILACKGVVICSGVGKSGHIAEKIAATLLSTGTRAFFLSPTNALHGDLGFVCPNDLFLGFSKSGASVELLRLLPHLKSRNVLTVAIVSKENSPLAQGSDLSVILPVEKEICPYDLAPTTSTAAQLIFGDCLAVSLMKAKQFALNDFAANHPSGFLGRKITLKVADLMLKGERLPLCRPDDRLLDVLHELSAKQCGALLIVDAKRRLLGIFTDGDLRRTLEKKGASALQLPMDQLMTKNPKSIFSTQRALDAVQKMEEDPHRLITVLPVLEQDLLVGLIRMHDVLQKELEK